MFQFSKIMTDLHKYSVNGILSFLKTTKHLTEGIFLLSDLKIKCLPLAKLKHSRMEINKIAITGAFGYTGKYVAERLLAQNKEVVTLTNSGNRKNMFGNKIAASPFHFDKPDMLIQSLKGTDVLVNTYWVRFNHKTFQHAEAVDNTKILFMAAKEAGIKKVVHVSITNPSLNSDLEYFKGKAVLEEALKESGMSYSIVRPAVIFGKEDILINNIAWVIRHLPLFGVYGKGDYKLQPIYVEDMADLIVREIFNPQNTIVNAIGSETYEYKDLVRMISEKIGVRRRIIEVSPWFGYIAGKIVSRFKGDLTITREEIKGLSDGLLYVADAPPAGKTKLSEWIEKHKDSVGVHYANELSRRLDRTKEY
jgi:NADH dehydrogenase